MGGRLSFRFGMPHVSVRCVQTLFERSVESFKHLHPIGMLVFNVIELLLHVARVTDFHDPRKCFDQFISNHGPEMGCVEQILDFFYVLTVLNHLNNLGVCAWSAYALCFELSYE